ncbi:MAG: response regulator [Acidobacteriia bacterium]|nr:response regulator [Terriglobia bacterium]
MSQTAANKTINTLWNMSVPLRMLVIEHTTADAESNLHELQRAGFQCQAHIVGTRAEILDHLRCFHYDIVLTDYQLPGWTGMDALSLVRQSIGEIPFILVTGALGEEVAVECIRQGVTDYVLKDHLSRLPIVVARALEEKNLRDARAFMVEALRQSESNSLFLFTHNPLPMWVFERESLQFLQVNDAALVHYGYERIEFLRMSVSDLHPPEEIPRLLRAFHDDSTHVQPVGQWHHRRKDGSVIDVEIFLHPMKYSGRAAALVVAQDITERRALEQQLQQSQKFEAIGQLAGGISHDVNNVIGAILGWVELGEEQAASNDARLATYFKKIHAQCDRVTALVRQLLAFARRQILEPRNISLNQSVQDVLNLLDNVIGKDIELHTVLADDLAVVRADPTQIEQVLMNLCINSRDAMPKGGRLSIETHNAEFSEELCRRNARLQPGRFVRLSVSDTGIGMDAAVRERIFEPFFTTKATGKGTGLGLSTVYGIVKQHGGFIQVESEPGRGSRFCVFLPVSEDAKPAEYRPPVVTDQAVCGGTETILIAEDHEGIREMASATLESLGYHVLLARDGEEAVAIFSAHRDSIALVLLDVIMPRRSGPETYEAITALKPGIPVIFATGYSNETAALTEMVERGIIVLQKPYSPRVLWRRVREALDYAAAGFSRTA